ncbi:MAG: hypothetical protein QOG76_7478, partial [Pseudonocardiales bacterium]|nr:hypothetical protein [Pseudonocardiales bacterium]
MEVLAPAKAELRQESFRFDGPVARWFPQGGSLVAGRAGP